tara:strand:+ start:120 stop:824 length:705 start_codon:yes stop_codon:yes gene_type:complete
MAFTKVTTGGLSQTSNYGTHNINSTGIVTAVKFVGDGSELDGVSSAGIGTALDSEDTTSPLNVIYYTDSVLGIGSTMVINHPNSAVAAYTPYTDIKIEGTADLIVSDGDDFVVDVLGIGTTGSASSQSGTGGRVRAGELTNTAGTGAPNFPLGATVTGIVTATSFSGSGANLTGLASREIYGFTGIGSHLQLTYSNNGADNISGTDFAAFEDEFIGPSGITWSINNDGNLIATI